MNTKHNRKSTHVARQRESNEWVTKSFIRNTRKRHVLYKKISTLSTGLSADTSTTILISKDMDWHSRSLHEEQCGTHAFVISLLPEKNKPSKKRPHKYSKHFNE